MEIATTFFKDVDKMSSRKRPKDVFQETSSKRLPGDVLKTFSRRRPEDLFQETSLRRLRLHQDFSSKIKRSPGDYLWIFNLHTFGTTPADTKTSQGRHKNVLFVVSKTSWISLKWKLRGPFFKTSSRRLPGAVLKTSCRKRPKNILQKTSSRPP